MHLSVLASGGAALRVLPLSCRFRVWIMLLYVLIWSAVGHFVVFVTYTFFSICSFVLHFHFMICLEWRS